MNYPIIFYVLEYYCPFLSENFNLFNILGERLPDPMKKLPFEYKITLIYVLLGALWILFSDQLVISFTSDTEKIQLLSTIKGWFYVIITGILLFYFVKKEIKRRNIIYNELLIAKKKADESDNLKSAFLANLSHYIRTPMNSILGFIDLLRNKNLSFDKHQRFIRIIDERSRHLLQTLESMVEISKIQQGQYLIHNKAFKIVEILLNHSANAETEIMGKNKSIAVINKFEVNDNFELQSDPAIVSQIISNLISNAINFTEKGKIEIGCLLKDNYCIIQITDTGTGIPHDKQKILFNEFMYHSSETINKGEGVGLGLHLSAKLAELIRGKLWLENTTDKGSVFCLSIPIC